MGEHWDDDSGCLSTTTDGAGTNLDWPEHPFLAHSRYPGDARFQDTPHETCLAALTRLKTLSLAQPVDQQTGWPMGTGKHAGKLTVLSSLCSLQVEAALHSVEHYSCVCDRWMACKVDNQSSHACIRWQASMLLQAPLCNAENHRHA